jgi:hypothetical protein
VGKMLRGTLVSEGQLLGGLAAKDRKSWGQFLEAWGGWGEACQEAGGVSAPRGASERQAVLGFSMEPLISQRRVTWMPGIPEPLGCSARGPPPSAASSQHRSLAPFGPPRPALWGGG